MFGRRWEPAQGTVVASRVVKTSGDGMVSVHEFVVDVTPADGEVFRAKVGEPRFAMNFTAPSVGAVVRVEVRAGSRTVRFDKDDPAVNLAVAKKQRSAAFDRTLEQPPGT